MKKVKRTIHFYELFSKNDSNVEKVLKLIFDKIIELNDKNSSTKFYSFGSENTAICTRNITHNCNNKQILGKILKVRKDMFPELFNTRSDTIKDIEAGEDEGIVEATHFLIDYNKQPTIAIEYNQYGARVNNLYFYFQYVGHLVNKEIALYGVPIIRDTLDSFIKRIKQCATFTVKVHKDNITRIQSVDVELFSALETANNFGKSEYIEIGLKFDKHQNTSKILGKVKKIISFFQRNKKSQDYFETLLVEAEDGDNNDRINLFDLISDKVKSIVLVQKRSKSRSLVSHDMFEKLKTEFNKQILKKSHNIKSYKQTPKTGVLFNSKTT